MADDLITPEDIRRQQNLIERFSNYVEGEDDILRGILQNQQVMTEIMLRQVTGSVAGDLSEGRAGVMLEATSGGSTGRAVFNVNGNDVVQTVSPTNDVNKDDVIIVSGPDNEVELTNAASKADLGGFLGGTQSAGVFKYEETDENVSIDPGEGFQTVLTTDAGTASGWYEVGVNDEQYALYQYEVDGNQLLDEPAKSPLGLYNDPYRFPKPLRVNSNVTVQVKVDNSAPGPIDFFAKNVLI